MENDKIKAVKKWKTPTKIKEVESFFRVCKLLSIIYQELQLKDKITSQLVLFLSKREGKLRVETDASRYVIKGVLLQEQERKLKSITFLSRTM